MATKRRDENSSGTAFTRLLHLGLGTRTREEADDDSDIVEIDLEHDETVIPLAPHDPNAHLDDAPPPRPVRGEQLPPPLKYRDIGDLNGVTEIVDDVPSHRRRKGEKQ